MDWDIPLWILQVVVALAFLVTGYSHSMGYERSIANPRLVWMQALPAKFVRAVGVLAIAGALGLILPALTGIAPWLTPLAALMLALLMACAIAFHLTRREFPHMAFNAILGVFATAIAYGRFVV
jgi:uncharacterized membrane protein YphA (DoxX/SURF4 family)